MDIEFSIWKYFFITILYILTRFDELKYISNSTIELKCVIITLN